MIRWIGDSVGQSVQRLGLLAAWLAACLALVSGCAVVPQPPASTSTCTSANTLRAEIVAFEQAYVLNRFGAYVPAGMMYALKRDVVALDPRRGAPGPGNAKLREDKRPRPLVLRAHEGGCLQVTLHNWMALEWEEEGGQPPEPTMVVGGRRVFAAPAHLVDPPGVPTSRELKPLGKTERDAPRTRSASFFVTGLEAERPPQCPLGAVCGGDGTYVGLTGQQGTYFNPRTPDAVKARYRSGSVVQPGQVSVTLWSARREGTFFAHSMGAPVGGEGDGGQIGLGLFAAVNVEPAQSRWYRSQVTKQVLDAARPDAPHADAHPYANVDYERRANNLPLLAMVHDGEIVHSDINAVIVRSEAQRLQCEARLQGTMADGQRCEPAFREFTVILHDEVHAVQAFPELEDEDNPLHYVKDGMGINYGVSSMGSTAYAAQPQRGVGPAAKCAECRAEEFFLSSWANGDPALVLQWDAQGKAPIGARYPDDPSNVHHSYLGDPVVFRNLHAGPKETHVFHLHAHQWVLDASDPNSTYLDSQTIAPGATFSYGIEFGGSGNRNFTPGDSIFHCHLYPHFAQGMWELWRVHDVFENGLLKGKYDPRKPAGPDNDPQSRALPDGEVAQGIATPATVPLPGLALPPMASAQFRGYPFYVPGEEGHRPPQPVLDMDVNDPAYADYKAEPPDPSRIVDGGLPRHVLTDGGSLKALNRLPPGSAEYKTVLDNAMSRGGEAAQVLARKVGREFPIAFQALAADWDQIRIKELPHSGTVDEKAAMTFHEGQLAVNAPLAQGGLKPVSMGTQPRPDWWTVGQAYRTAFAATAPGMTAPAGEPLFRVNGRGRAPGAPYANPCPVNAPQRNYRAAFIQTEMTVNRHGWFDPQGRMVILEDDIKDTIDASTRTRMPEPLFFRANSGDCINFKSTNLVPSALNADDYQIYTPTDTIGQHIHLVKFDVTSSDGSGNGFNYEDSTFSPDEVRERIFANNRRPDARRLAPKPHPLFAAGGNIFEASRGDPYFAALARRGTCPPQGTLSDHAYEELLRREHPYCGAQRTTQRWWADPILVRSGALAGKDNTLRTVFTHDHMGPSSHQQHGLYAALVIEPSNSVWRADAPADTGRRTAIEAQCSATLADAAALGIEAPAPDLAPLDRGVAAAFAVRQALANPGRGGQPSDAPLRQRADACLAGTLIGGSDLSASVLPGNGAGDAQIAMLAPRPPWRHPQRQDGGPTSPRAVIVSPTCLNQPNSSPYIAGVAARCSGGEAAQTRREFGVAFADFAGVYNVALEPINTEKPRDVSMRRFGERQVAQRPARPLVIASEDPGTQLVNYRHEPLALRIAELDWNPLLGGFDLHQSGRRTQGSAVCREGDTDCLGDMANGFSSEVHSRRDRALATNRYVDWLATQGRAPPPRPASAGKPAARATVDLVSPVLASMFASAADRTRLEKVVDSVEQWRQDFNCSLYAAEQWRPSLGVPAATPGPFPVVGTANASAQFQGRMDDDFSRFCNARLGASRRAPIVAEPWRVFGDPATPVLAAHEGDPVQIRLIQGAQEAQHVFTMNGVKWHRIADSANSGLTNAQPLGISEHFEFDVRVPSLNVAHADYLYFGSSIDQLWDGMWGTLRAYCDPRLPASLCRREAALGDPAQRLTRVPRALATARPAENLKAETAACAADHAVGGPISVKSFDVSAVRVCELFGNCGQSGAGTVYSRRYGITDPNALIYALNRESESCSRSAGDLGKGGCFEGDPSITLPGNDVTLTQLKADFASGRRHIEPLVLRAAAGQCITVKLRNHLSPKAAGPLREALLEKDAFHNFLPMITDGFNLNQFGMSHSVGLSAPRVTQNVALADGSNVGLNGAVLSTSQNREPLADMGSLVPPCGTVNGRLSPEERDRLCTRDYVWSATDLQRHDAAGRPFVDERGRPTVKNVPVEYGALPLRSFGDAVKHPVHGLVGALVIGPKSSQVCQDPSRPPGGTSRTICDAAGKRLYGDHVLVMQDAVSAAQGGFPVPDLKGAEEPDDYGVKAINYKTEPLWARRGGSPSTDFGVRSTEFDYTTVFSSAREGRGCEAGMPANGDGPLACDPETPVMEATVGESIRLHFVHPGGHTRQQGLTISGHGVNPHPWDQDSTVFNPGRCDAATVPMPSGCLLHQGVYNGFGPMSGVTLAVKAGGSGGVAKDYLVRSQASFLLDGGLWGILRVRPAPSKP